MRKFSERSLRNLEGVHPDLVRVVHKALEICEVDFTVVEGVRTLETQRKYFERGASKTMKSRHLVQADGFAHAVDIYPYYAGSVQVHAPFAKFRAIADAIREAARQLCVNVTWGADWDRDGDTGDERFVDAPHYQIELA